MVYSFLFLLALHGTAAEPDRALEPAGVLDEPIGPFEPRTRRSEGDAFKVASAAHYAHGRMLYQRQDYAGALRRFQRAWRYNPETVSNLREIVFLAHRLKRRDETVRYALLAAEHTEIDYQVLLRLAGWLNDRQEWDGAIRLYEKALDKQTRTARPSGSEPDVGSVLLQFELGRLYFLNKDFDKSADFLSRVRVALENPELLSQNESLQKMVVGQADRTYQLLAESFLQAGRYDDAVAMFKKVNTAKKTEGLLSFHIARVAAKRGKNEDALRRLDGYFQAKADVAGTEPYELLADMLRKTTQNEDQAKRQLQTRLQQLLKNDAENKSLMYYLAGVHRKHKRWGEAQKLLEQLVELDPATEIYDGLIEVYQAQGRQDKLLETLGKAVALAGSLKAVGENGEKLAANGKLADELKADVRKRLEKEGESLGAEVPLGVAWLAFQREQYDVGQQLFDVALASTEESSKARLMLNWGLELLLAKQYEQAARLFQRGFDEKVVGDRGDLWSFYLIRALALSGKTDKAIEVAARATAEHADSPRIQAQPGWVLYYAKRYAEAEKCYVAFLDKFDDQHDTSDIRDQMRDARLILSNLCVEFDRWAEAEEWLEEVLDEFPEDIGALNDLGYLWTEQNKNLTRALAMIQKAVEEDSENVAYIDSLGWVYYRLGRYEDAVRELEKAVSLDDDPDGVILDHLADAYIKTDRKDKAINTWRKAVKSFEEDKDAEKRKATLEKIKQHEK